MVAKPPMPLPMKTPVRAASLPCTVKEASSRAKSAAAMASWMKRSTFLSSFFSRKRSGSKPFTSQANRVLWWEASKRVMGPAPERPARRACQVSSVPIPTGDTRPTPVTTTLWVGVTSRPSCTPVVAYFLPECFSM
jgi:hypothetical protein